MTLSPRCVLGLDVGGTKTAGGVVDADGRVAFHETIPTLAQRGGDPVADDVYWLAERLMGQARASSLDPTAIGISLCELVDTAGEIVSGETIAWRTDAIVRRFGQLAPTVIEADCRAAAVAEARYGAGRDWPNFLYVTIGTGISCSLVIEGRPYVGARGLTGTMASGPLTLPCGECGKLSTVVVERIASGPAIARRFNDMTGAAASGAEGVLAAADDGDATARQIVLTAAEAVGSVVGMLVGVLDPQAVVIGGGLGSARGSYSRTLEGAIREHIWSEQQRPLPIVQGRLGPLAGVVGAGVIAMDQNAGGFDARQTSKNSLE